MATKQLKFVTSDNEHFQVDAEVIKQLETIKNLVEDCGGCSGEIPLTNVDNETFTKIVEFCNHHVIHPYEAPKTQFKVDRTQELVDEWDVHFGENLPIPLLGKLKCAASYLQVEALNIVISKHIARRMNNKTTDEMREILRELGVVIQIEDDFEPGDKEQIIQENTWTDEK